MSTDTIYTCASSLYVFETNIVIELFPIVLVLLDTLMLARAQLSTHLDLRKYAMWLR